MADITLRRIDDPAALEGKWRDLESRADARIFQGWSWTGCLAAERFTSPVLAEARAGGETVGLALWNARPLWPALGGFSATGLHLGEAGEPARDAVTIEHNAPLLARGHTDLLGPMLRAALRAGLAGTTLACRRLLLSGVGDAVLRAAQDLPAVCRVQQSRPAPFVDLPALGGAEYAASLGTSTRYQLRRALRRYATSGPIVLHRAADPAQALRFFAQLTVLHQATWQGRGQPGAFASPFMRRFHETLIARGFARGEIDLLHVAAGERTVGYLYNLVGEGGRWVGNYQAGFDYATAHPHEKPGLVCHALAVERYREEGRRVYDLLAGASRYKASLANRETTLHWLSLASAFSPPDLAARGWQAARIVRRGFRSAGETVTRLARR